MVKDYLWDLPVTLFRFLLAGLRCLLSYIAFAVVSRKGWGEEEQKETGRQGGRG